LTPFFEIAAKMIYFFEIKPLLKENPDLFIKEIQCSKVIGDVIQEYQVEKWLKFFDCLEKSNVTDIVRIISIMPKALSAIFTHTFYAGYSGSSDLLQSSCLISTKGCYQVENAFKIRFIKF